MLYSFLADKLVQAAIRCGAVKQEDEAVYRYGLEALVGHVFSFATMFLLALLCGIPQYAVLYVILMYPLRIYSGGFHASTPGRCYLISTLMFAAMIACEPLVCGILSKESLAVLLLIISAVIFALAPAESENKPFEQDESRRYRKASRGILAGELLILTGMYLLHCPVRWQYYALAAPATVALLLLLHEIRKRFHSITCRQENQETEKSI